MAYISMKKLIKNLNIKYNNGNLDAENYANYKENYMNKLDVFLSCNRLTSNQYKELVEMFIEIDNSSKTTAETTEV